MDGISIFPVGLFWSFKFKMDALVVTSGGGTNTILSNLPVSYKNQKSILVMLEAWKL